MATEGMRYPSGTLAGSHFGRACIAYALLGALSGCKPTAEVPYETFPEARTRPPIDTSRGDAFDWYASAALDAEAKAPAYINWVSFRESDRTKIIALLRDPMTKVEQGTKLTCNFRFAPTEPFEKPPLLAGWRILGRAFAWRIERAVGNKDPAGAVRVFLAATRFGMDLTAGDALTASLGLAIVDEARAALLGGRVLLEPEDLRRVASGLTEIVARVPEATLTMDCEAQQMLLAVAFVQETYRTRQYDALTTNLGVEIKNATDALDAMHGNDAGERPAYFRGFAEEARARAKRLRELAAMPTVDRRERGAFKAENDRPWRRFVRHFLTAGEPYLDMRDRTLARTRLLLIECHALAYVKSGKPAPSGLSPLPDAAVTDPFTGSPLRYLASGNTFRAYSVGGNFTDDGGESGEDGESPDLVLEPG